ncbi:MAG: DUF433 domain-containing protein [Chloroflexi bacterium]|nr:DUF433 domain-containing protein [Chloroflexota bacterium]
MNAKRNEPRKYKAPRAANGRKRTTRVKGASNQKTATKRVVHELFGGEPYNYYPLGKYIVAAPGVCGGRPTFKYTRIEAAHALELIAAGWTIEAIAAKWWGGKVSPDAIREAVKT